MCFRYLFGLVLLATIAVSLGTELEVIVFIFLLIIFSFSEYSIYFVRHSINSPKMHVRTPIIGQFWWTRHDFGSIIVTWQMCCPFIGR